MKITITNEFHGTAVEVVPTETYTLESGQPCAVLPYTEYLRARKALCGMHDCSCLKVPGTGFGSDGVRYVLKFE